MSGSPRQSSVPSRCARSARRPPNVTRVAAPPASSSAQPRGHDRERPRRLVGEDLELRGAIGVERAVAVQMVLGQVEQHGGLGRERLRVLELERRQPRRRSPRPASSVPGSDTSAVPTLPATTTGSPATRWMWPISSTVVVLPLEPVSAMNSFGSSRQPSSTSPITRIPCAQRRRDQRRLPRHARALDHGARSRRAASAPLSPSRTSTPAASSRARCTLRVHRPGVGPDAPPPRDPASASAARHPERASPTHENGPGGSGGGRITAPIQQRAAVQRCTARRRPVYSVANAEDAMQLRQQPWRRLRVGAASAS